MDTILYPGSLSGIQLRSRHYDNMCYFSSLLLSGRLLLSFFDFMGLTVLKCTGQLPCMVALSYDSLVGWGDGTLIAFGDKLH